MPISEVYNMDCMEYMKGIPDKFFDLAIVDPQYGIDIMHKGGMPKHLGFKQYKRKDWDKKPPGKRYFQELFRVSKNQIIFGGNYFTQHLPPKMGWIVWDKGQHGLTMSDGELAWSSFDKALRIITDGTRGDSPGCGSVLIAFGRENAEILRNCSLQGKYVELNNDK